MPDRTLILKLFYVNSSNRAAVVHEFRRVKGMHKGKSRDPFVRRMLKQSRTLDRLL